ncbi:hypothetical protein RRG08_003758 [Elysia crispata]|uniref:Uncharacterized protein n=1 Tax=Elysia crispata TaxID=231223 RepID=A0AAE1E5C0_9GAST|nr:hypothetical protein RRG08_003758 [Elysia crispata]
MKYTLHLSKEIEGCEFERGIPLISQVNVTKIHILNNERKQDGHALQLPRQVHYVFSWLINDADLRGCHSLTGMLNILDTERLLCM